MGYLIWLYRLTAIGMKSDEFHFSSGCTAVQIVDIHETIGKILIQNEKEHHKDKLTQRSKNGSIV